MPRMGGMELLKKLHSRSFVRVLRLTARGDDIGRIVGLEVEADNAAEAVQAARARCRIRAIPRRLDDRRAGPDRFTSGDTMIDIAKREAWSTALRCTSQPSSSLCLRSWSVMRDGPPPADTSPILHREESWGHSIARSTSISAISEISWTPIAASTTSRPRAAATICLRRAGRSMPHLFLKISLWFWATMILTKSKNRAQLASRSC